MDFLMVMPLGPDFAGDLKIEYSDLGWIGGSYTAASALAGILCSFFIDMFDRKTALLTAFSGLILSTILGGFAWNFHSLLASRILAGLFGGPVTSLVWAIVADTVEPSQRGQATGKVMSAFSFAAIIGVPFGLYMSHLHNWTTPFFATSFLGLAVLFLIVRFMPPMHAHLSLVYDKISFRYIGSLATRPVNALTYLYIMIAMLASFMIIPNLSAYVQYNLHFSRDYLGWLYSIGGIVSFITVRLTGKLIDRYSATITSTAGMIVFIIVLWGGFIMQDTRMPVTLIFTMFMFAMGLRNVSSNTLATQIPPPQERAGFMSLFSCIQGIGMAAGAFFSTHMLTENSDKSLNGMNHIAMISTALSLFVPVLINIVESQLENTQYQEVHLPKKPN
jgi:predicted MFS family arabinose efflux permease